jgi:GDP-4-dehydro-6-deoxy-D-mannose reductase
MKPRYLLLGSNGAIGGRFKGILSSNKQIELDCMEGRFSKSKLEEIVIKKKPNYIINCIGVIDGSFKKCIEVNLLVSKQILDLIYNKKLKTRILLIGSAAEYGNVRPDENPIKETFKCSPYTDYGISKYWQSILAQKYAEMGVDVVVGRVFNIDSEALSTKLFLGNLINQIIKIKKGDIDRIEIGPLDDSRDYIDIEQAIKKLLLIIRFGKKGEIYNVGSGYAVSMREMMNKYLKKYKIDPIIIENKKEQKNRIKIIYSDNKKYEKLISNNDNK